ncbi:MAG TPA: hypothetical protein VFO29_02425 [Candidatus Rubrimentiphilum sp.]|nr:hypothetical protein [Candidatus Rubrimentiphilum sp.]
MKIRSTTTSVLAAAAAACILGSVAAAPTSKPPSKPAPKKPSSPAVSKFRQHQLDMMKISAPGDEYFGRLKMSYLGIENTFHDESIRAGAYTTDSHIISQVDFAEEALRQWYQRYPKDPQLPRAYFLAYAMYHKTWTLPGQTKAWQYLHIIAARWPKSYFGKLVQKDLVGFTEHYFMEPQPCPTQAPTESPSPGSRRRPPTPSPSPSPTPEPTATPSPAPGQPAVEILPVPCYTPIPPTPSPTPVPSIVPSVVPSALGSPVPLPSGALTPTPSLTPSPAPTRSPR